VRVPKQTAMAVTLVIATAGCIRYGAGEAAEGALGSVLDEMAEEERREQLAEVAASPEMQEAVEDLTRAVARAAVAGMAEELDAVLTEDLDEQARARMEPLVGGLTEAMLVAFADNMRAEVGPAMRQVLARDVGAGMAEALDGPLGHALARTARNVGRELTVGTGEGVATLADADAPPSVPALAALTQGGMSLLHVGAAILALLVLLLASLLGYLIVRTRHARAEAHAREESLLVLLTAIKGAQGQPWAPELRALLGRELRDQQGAERLRELLRRHPELRLLGDDVVREPSGARPREPWAGGAEARPGS
jgi:hypothetical protein